MMQEREYSMCEMEAECGFAHVQALQSCFVNICGSGQREKMVKQFHRALRILKLEPFIHPSQLNETISTHKARDEKTTHVDGGDIQGSKEDGKGYSPRKILLFC